VILARALWLLAAALAPRPAESAMPDLSKTTAAQVHILETSHDREALESAARSLATSGDPAAIERLGQWLGRPELLGRLDDLGDGGSKTYHLGRVLGALAEHPSPATESLCLALLRNPAFLADPDRKIDLLPALAAVRPLSEAAAKAFQEANAEGLASANLPLLVKNGSPRALALFEAMVRDRGQEAESRVADIHAAVLPRRTDPQLLRAIDRLLAARDLEKPVALGLIETVFDYQSRRWFGPARTPPAPPPWSSAPPETAELVVALAAKAKRRPSLPPSLRAAIDKTLAELRRPAAPKKK
jgi:hypothetical protein